jgi:hypothetical protein
MRDSARRRLDRRLLLVGGLALAVLASNLAVWLRLDHLDQLGSDFSASYVAGITWLHGGNLYDQALEHARLLSLLPAHTRVTLPFITPPLTAVLVAPLTHLGLATAYRVFSLVQLLLVAAAAIVAVRSAPWPADRRPGLRAAAVLCALASTGASYALLLLGQWDGVSALGLALAYAAWRRGHEGRAGALLIGSALLAKPHLALGLAVWLLALRNRRALIGAAAAAATVVLASIALAGPGSLAGWVGALRVSTSTSPLASLVGFTGLLGSWIGNGAAVETAAGVCSVLALAVCWALGDRARRTQGLLEPSLAGATALSLLAAPHLLTHDLALLVPALVWTVAWAAASDPGGRRLAAVATGWVVLSLTARLDFNQVAMAPPGRLTPVVLLAIGAIAARACGVRLRRPAMPHLRRLQSIPGTGSGVGGSVE